MTSDLEAEIAETREHLGETVDALAAKLDVKARAKDADKRPLAAALIVAAGLTAAVVLWPRGR